METSTEEKQRTDIPSDSPAMFGGEQVAEDQDRAMPVLPIFGYRQLNPEGTARAIVVSRAFSELLRVLERACPAGREFSLVRTKLEEACMFAKKSISVDPRYT